MKIVVYAISKNESKFCERWVKSMREADEIVVLDTGSTDDTVERLRGLGCKVEVGVVNPWRFDVARNMSIDLANKLVPDADVLVCTDLDEVFREGWRDALECAWDNAIERGFSPTTATYEYVWSFNADGSDGCKFTYEKIHTPNVARWEHPVHEVLGYKVPKVDVHVDGMRLEHYPDGAKSRSQYLGLLEMSVEESPNDDRNMHYLGREYMFRGMWDKAIETLKRHLALPSALWRAERASSMRFIARCYGGKGDESEREKWLLRACVEAPEQREAVSELATVYYERKDWMSLVRACEICLERNTRVMSYLTEAECWGARPWDLYSIGLWWIGDKERAVKAARQALALKPDDERIRGNVEMMEKELRG